MWSEVLCIVLQNKCHAALNGIDSGPMCATLLFSGGPLVCTSNECGQNLIINCQIRKTIT